MPDNFIEKLNLIKQKSVDNPIKEFRSSISIYVPANVPTKAVLRQLFDEANRIKNSTTDIDQKKLLLAMLFAIERTIIKKYKDNSPISGFGLFCLPITDRIPSEHTIGKISSIDIVCPPDGWKPIEEFLYVCDWFLYLDHFEKKI